MQDICTDEPQSLDEGSKRWMMVLTTKLNVKSGATSKFAITNTWEHLVFLYLEWSM